MLYYVADRDDADNPEIPQSNNYRASIALTYRQKCICSQLAANLATTIQSVLEPQTYITLPSGTRPQRDARLAKRGSLSHAPFTG